MSDFVDPGYLESLLAQADIEAPMKPSSVVPQQSVVPAGEFDPDRPDTQSPDLRLQPPTMNKTYASLCAILRNDGRVLEAPLRWNEMQQCPTISGAAFDDHMSGVLRERIELLLSDNKGKPLQFASADIEQAVVQVALENRYHPVRDYLEALHWDGVKRIAALADEVLGVERSAYNIAVLNRWAIGCVARIYEPGCDSQMVLTLTGGEDVGKSRFFATLAGFNWFSDRAVDIGNKDTVMLMQRVWILEWGELAAIRSKDWELVKSFITSRDDDFRPPYGKKVVRQPRACVIVGTANDHEFLQGREGERRFWPIAIPNGVKIDLEKLADWRDQIWAEARAYFLGLQQWHLTDDEKKLLKVAHSSHVDDHPWHGVIGHWVESWTGEITTTLILEKALSLSPKDWTHSHRMSVAKCMKVLGWCQPGSRIDGTNSGERIWKRKQM